MRSDPSSLEINLHHRLRRPRLDLFVDEWVRNAVVVLVHLHVVIDADTALLPRRYLVSLWGQWLQGRSIHSLEKLPSARPKLLHLPSIQNLQLLSNRFVQLGQTEKRLIPKHR